MKNNKQLYESIMKSVAKTVKKVLNESFIDDEIEQTDINLDLSRGADAFYLSYKKEFDALPYRYAEKTEANTNSINLPYYYKYDLNSLTLTILGSIYVDALFELLQLPIPISKLQIETSNSPLGYWYNRTIIKEIPDNITNIIINSSKCKVDLSELRFSSETSQQLFFDFFKLFTPNAAFTLSGLGYVDADDKAFARVIADINGISKMNFNIKQSEKAICRTAYFLTAFRENLPSISDYDKGNFNYSLHNEKCIRMLNCCRNLGVSYTSLAFGYYKTMQAAANGKSISIKGKTYTL